MNGLLGLRGLFLATAAAGVMGMSAPPTGAPETAVLYFFTTPESEAGQAGARRAKGFIAKHAGQAKLRPVLLAKDFSLLRTITEKSPLTLTIKELEAGSKPGALDIPLFDEEGLRLADLWGVRSVPAFVLVRGGQAHRTAGAASNLEELWECSR